MASMVCKPFASFNPLTGFKQCTEVVPEPEPEEQSLLMPIVLALCVALAVAAIVMKRPKKVPKTEVESTPDTSAAMSPPAEPVEAVKAVAKARPACVIESVNPVEWCPRACSHLPPNTAEQEATPLERAETMVKEAWEKLTA